MIKILGRIQCEMVLPKFIIFNSQKCFSNTIMFKAIRSISSNSFKIQDEEDFTERVLKSDKPVIVDFMATWCKPCTLLAPRIEHVIDEKRGKVLLAKVDVDENSEIALNYDVSAVPVLLSFQDGKPGERLIGLQDEDKLRALVNRCVRE